MALGAPARSFTVTEVDTFGDCEARFYHAKQGYKADVLASDRTAADFGSAVHGALMAFHRQVQRAHRQGNALSVDMAEAHLRALIDEALRGKRLSAHNPTVLERLAAAEAGVKQAAVLVVADAPTWATDAARGDALMWVEQPLDHGPGVKAVELQPGYVVRTQPHVIGLRTTLPGRCRALVRDYKTRMWVVDPAFDNGALTRAIWVWRELQQRRCLWFLGKRTIDVEPDVVDVEVVNLLYGESADFLVRTTLTGEQLLAHRDRLVTMLTAMERALEAASVSEVTPNPSGFCLRWCPFLNRCEPGMAHVREHHGEEDLAARLAPSV